MVPWAAGGGTDGLARAIAKEASKTFGVMVNVVNREGGSGTMGHSFGANTARPDGYTVTMITYELSTYKPLGKAPIDENDFKAVIQLNYDPGAITVHANSPWKTLTEFIEYAKAHPGELTVGNSGPGAVWHLAAVKFEKAAGIKLTHIPHDGAKPAVTQLVGKHLDAVSVSPAEVVQYIQEGSLRCLGIMSEARDPLLADVPTFKEQGVDLDYGTWRGLAAPAATPDEIVRKLEEGFKKAYDSPAFHEAAQKALLGLEYRNAQDFTIFLHEQSRTVAELVKDLNL